MNFILHSSTTRILVKMQNGVYAGNDMVPIEESTLPHELLDSLQRRLCSSVQYKTSSSNVRVVMVDNDPLAVSALLVAQTSIAGHTLWHYYLASAMQASHTMNKLSGYEGSPQHLPKHIRNSYFDPDVSQDPDPTCHCIPRPLYSPTASKTLGRYEAPQAVLRDRGSCPFLDLPRELRDRIYRYTLAGGETVLDIEPSRSSKIKLYTDLNASPNRLVVVNHQVREEFQEESERYCRDRPLLVLTTLTQKWTRSTAPAISQYVIRLGYLALNMLSQIEDHVRALYKAGVKEVHIILLLMPTTGDIMPRTTQDMLASLGTSLHESPLGKAFGCNMKVRFSAIVRQRLEEYDFVGHEQALVTMNSAFARFGIMKSLKPPHSLERNAFMVNRHILRVNDMRGLFELLRDYDAPSEMETLIASMNWKHAIVPAISRTEKTILEKVIPTVKQSSIIGARLPLDAAG